MSVEARTLEAMRRAIALSVQAHPHPNPRVGAVILDAHGNIIAEGFHARPGEPHAERAALAALGSPPPPGSTMVVTLEPCAHHGRTPPCTEAILESRIERVVVGAVDPDPRNRGVGIEILRDSGVEVVTGVAAADVEAADPAYFHHRRTGRPLVTLKTAMTLDGQTATKDGTSQWITTEDARLDSHSLRADQDAVLVGAGTLRSDDPALTVRLPGYDGPQPTAVVLAGDSPLPADARLWSRPDTIVVSARPHDLPIQVVEVAPGDDGLPHPNAVLEALGERGLLGVLVEGGAVIAETFWRHGLVDRGVTYIGAKVAGGVGRGVMTGEWRTFSDARPVEITGVRRLGTDLRIDWRPVRESDSDD